VKQSENPPYEAKQSMRYVFEKGELTIRSRFAPTCMYSR
jgi:hypothetical protein